MLLTNMELQWLLPEFGILDIETSDKTESIRSAIKTSDLQTR